MFSQLRGQTITDWSMLAGSKISNYTSEKSMKHIITRKKEVVNMFYCKKCVMPNTRPGITFNKEGI